MPDVKSNIFEKKWLHMTLADAYILPATMITTAPDLNGVLAIDDLARVLHLHVNTIKRRIRAGTFPIPPLPLDDAQKGRVRPHLRWAGPVVRAYIQSNGLSQSRRRK